MGAREGRERTKRPKGEREAETALRQFLEWVPELGRTLRDEGRAEAIWKQLDGLRDEMSRRAQQTGRDIEARAERLWADFERQAARGLKPLLSRVNVASRPEVATLESRVEHLEGRIGDLLDDRAALTTRVQELGRQLDEARADASERVHELTMRLAAGDSLREDLTEARSHLDALSKDHVTRGLDVGKLHDRLVRLEMRLGDLLKEHSSALADQEDTRRRLGALEQTIDGLTAKAQGATDRAIESTAASRGAAAKLAALGEDRAADRTELGRLGQLVADGERVLRQIELRLGDLGERQTMLREELVALGARVSQLELTSARAETRRADTSEGH